MRILIDIGHPAHVHYFRNMANELESKNHLVFWTVKDIEVAKTLLRHYGFGFFVLPKKIDNTFGKVLHQLRYDYILYKFCRKEKIDMAIGSSVTITHIKWLLKTKSILFDDDDDLIQPLAAKFAVPFADAVVAPDAIKQKSGKTVFYPGYQELAYLHPKRFTPCPSVLNEFELMPGERFFLMRFNAFKAHHDIGVKGLSIDQKLKLINILKAYGKIFISAEREVEPELRQFKLTIGPEKIHSLLSYATMFIGDSQTMTTEAAVLGVPAIKYNTLAGKLSVPNELEYKYNLCYSFLPGNFDRMVLKIKDLLAIPDIRNVWQKRRMIMLKDKIDVTSFFTWFIINYPESIRIFNDNTEKINEFK